MMTLRSLSLFTALAAVSSVALADTTVHIAWQGKDLTGAQLTAYDTSYSTTSAVVNTVYRTTALNYTNTDTSESFIAYCLEPSASNTKASVAYTASTFSGARSNLVQGLYSSYYDGLTTTTDKAAFQVALWEIMRETGTPSNVTTGSFYLGAGYDTIAQTANDYLVHAASYTGPALYSLTLLSNPVQQDLLTATRVLQPVTSVPEPESYALFLAGLGAVGLMARRRMPR